MKYPPLKIIILRCIITLFPFAFIFLITKAFFEDAYLLEWLLRHWYCGLWGVTVIVALFNFKLSLAISYSNIIAIALGQIVGDIIRDNNISNITPDMSIEQQAHLYLHHGFAIWLLSLLLFIAGFLAMTYFKKIMMKRKNNV